MNVLYGCAKCGQAMADKSNPRRLRWECAPCGYYAEVDLPLPKHQQSRSAKRPAKSNKRARARR